jgi:hypothetical protein
MANGEKVENAELSNAAANIRMGNVTNPRLKGSRQQDSRRARAAALLRLLQKRDWNGSNGRRAILNSLPARV